MILIKFKLKKMRRIDNLPDEFHIRLRDDNQRDDINIKVIDFLKTLIEILNNTQDPLSEVFNPPVSDTTPTTKEVGHITSGTLAGALRGKTFNELWTMALFKGIPPIYNSPTIELSGSVPRLFQVGESANIFLDGTFTQNNAGSVISVKMKQDGITVSSLNPYNFQLTSSQEASFNYTFSVDYNEGPILNDSYGNPSPAGHIQAGTLVSDIIKYSFVYPIFWGVSTDNILTETDIIAGNVILNTDYSEINVTFNSTSSQYLWFAVPSNIPDYTHWFVNLGNQGDIGNPTVLFNAPTTIQLSNSNWNNVSYKLYISNFTTEVTESMKIS